MNIYNSSPSLANFIGWVFILMSAYPSLSKAMPETHFRIAMSHPSAELVLMFSHPPVYVVRDTRQGQVINFDHPLALSDLTLANKRLSVWVKNVAASYDTLLLQLHQGVTLEQKVSGNDLHLIFTLGKTEINTSEAELSRISLELERLNTLLMLDAGDIEDACDHLKDLLEIHPENIQLMLDIARVEERLHNWRQALGLYELAHALKPYSPSIERAKASLLRTYGSRIRTEAIHNQVGSDNAQLIAKIQGRKLMSNGYVWSLDYTLWDIENDYGVRHIDGEIKPFYGQRNVLNLGLETELFSGEQKIMLFAGDKQSGLGWSYGDAGDYGWAGVQLAWRAPWYEYSEALLYYAYRDRVALNYSNTFGKNISFTSGISTNRYGLDELGEAVKSNQLQMGIRYWMLSAGTGFSLGYALDKENTYSHLELMDSQGNLFRPLPLESREQQVVDLGWNNRLAEYYYLATHLGYEFDLLRDVTAPFGRLTLSYQRGADFEASLNVQTGLTNYNEGSDNFFSIGGSLSWFFAS